VAAAAANYVFDTVIVPVSSGTIAAGVIKGFAENGPAGQTMTRFILHLGYKRPHQEVSDYVLGMSGCPAPHSLIIDIVDEEYRYKDKGKPGPTPPWPCNPYYDLKAFRWWMRGAHPRGRYGKTLFWNIG
jgi:hypothetical protein